jgi:hypothetical protein
VPEGYEVLLFEEENRQGAYLILSGDISTLGYYGFNDRVKSIIYREKSGKTVFHPQFFEEPEFKGMEISLPFGTTIFEGLKHFGSIKIPVGMHVSVTTVYGPRFKKRTFILKAEDIEVPLITDPIESITVSLDI